MRETCLQLAVQLVVAEHALARHLVLSTRLLRSTAPETRLQRQLHRHGRFYGSSGDSSKLSSSASGAAKEALSDEKQKEMRTPWQREGVDTPPAVKVPAKAHAASTATRGKLLTTPSRLLKLIVPLTALKSTADGNEEDVEPLALLVHPQQPLSYLERLIQAELPTLKDANGKETIPSVFFKAEDSTQDDDELGKKPSRLGSATAENAQDSTARSHEESKDIDKREQSSAGVNAILRGGPGQGGVESYSGHGRHLPSAPRPDTRKFVRWSQSTEIGDFIRDAARGAEFAIEIQGAAREIRIGVPSFADRTHYLRLRLRRTARQILDLAALKRECDAAAHAGAQRVAIAGFVALAAWWATVYRLTFRSELGWSVMEPVTYLVGLSTLIAGYAWFLYHNRDVSYRSALNISISRRQTQLYQAKGFDLQRWEALVAEGNALRKDIKAVADEYDVDWDERADEHDEVVVEVLKKNRAKKKQSKKDAEREEEDEEEND